MGVFLELFSFNSSFSGNLAFKYKYKQIYQHLLAQPEMDREALLHDQRARNLVQKQLCPDGGYGIICPEAYAVLEEKTKSYEKFLKIVFFAFSCLQIVVFPS